MTCIRPIAPADEVIGRPFSIVCPPLSIRITPRTHDGGRLNRRAASSIISSHCEMGAPEKRGRGYRDAP